MVKYIPLGGTRSNGSFALVDEDVYDSLIKYRWWCNSDGYPIRIEYENGKYKKQIFMHKEILKVPKGKQVDHINRDKKDNRISNLREVTPSQNQANRGLDSHNTSGYKGVSFDKKAKKYRAYVRKDGKTYNLGFYTEREQAAKAYNLKATELFGEYANLNDVDHTGFKLNIRKRHSQYRGVSKIGDVWTSTLIHDGKHLYLGRFKEEKDAARMYNFWALDLFGEFAKLNVIKEAQ